MISIHERCRLRWLGHVERMDGTNWVRRSREIPVTVDGCHGRGIPHKRLGMRLVVCDLVAKDLHPIL